MQTFVMKVIFPVVWIVAFGAGTLGLWLGMFHAADGSLPPPEMRWMLLGIWGLGSAFTWWSCARLKRVRLTDATLLISNYWREIRVPLQDVQAVTENRWLNLHPVTLYLRHPTVFGSRVVFMPKTRWWGGWQSHPIVEELQRLVQQANH